MDKNEVRKEIIRFQKDLNNEQRNSLSRQCSNKMVEQRIWQEADEILLFMTFDCEFETSFLLKKAFDSGKKVAVPRIYGKEMKFHYIDSIQGPFQTNRWGIKEPLDISPVWISGEKSTLMLTPGLAFNLNGGRLGRGGGFYDRFLSLYGTAIRTTGLCFEEQIRSDFPVESHDHKLEALCSEKTFYLF